MVGGDGHVKLIDFGFAKKLRGEMRTMTNCGTLGYAAPEVVNGASVGYSF
jgi:protein kinase A